MEIIRAGKEWKDRIIAFANQVFWKDVGPEGFPMILPDVYGAWGACDGNHLLILEDGEIQALLLTEPVTLVCGREQLAGIGIGTVSVSGQARGRGHMQLLLKTVRQWLEEEGYAFAVLSGQRQRYAYWGYEPAGIRVRAEISPASVKHALSDARIPDESLPELFPMQEEDPDVDRAYALSQSLPVHTLRKRETFIPHLQAGRSRPFVIRRNGEFAGYLTASFRKSGISVTELELLDESLLSGTLKAFFRSEAPEGYELFLPPYYRERLSCVEGICEEMSVSSEHSWYVADLKRLLAFSMKIRQTTTGLNDGAWTFATERGCFHCEVKDGRIRVEQKPVPGEGADGGTAGFSAGPEECLRRAREAGIFAAPQGEMTRILFGPMAAVGRNVPAPAGWLPFSLYLPEADMV